MLVEISVTVNYLLSHLYTKLPRRRVDSFGEELEKHLFAKFHNKWFPQDPTKEATSRCLYASGSHVDPLFPECAIINGLDWNEIQACLPDKLIFNVDPGYVACQYNQTAFTVQDFTRYSSNSIWPSSISLSSSGCSSASSSTSSTNLTPSSDQITHQILYCAQDSWPSIQNKSWIDTSSVASKTQKNDTENGISLATAAALSVLVDPDETALKKLTQEGIQSENLEQHLHNLLSSDSSNMNTNYTIQNNGFDDLECSKLEIPNGNETDPPMTNFPWGYAGSDAESALISLINTEYSSSTNQSARAVLQNERPLQPIALNRSSSDPRETEKLHQSSFSRDSTLINSNSCVTDVRIPFNNKLDQNGSRLTESNTMRLSSNYNPNILTMGNTINASFAQKSTSSPSFTAATFAQTKFGSTKLKHHIKRAPNRIVPATTETQTYFGPTRDSIGSVAVSKQPFIQSGQKTDLNSGQRFLPVHLDLNSEHEPNLLPMVNSESLTPFTLDYSRMGSVLDEFSGTFPDSWVGTNEEKMTSFPFQKQNACQLNSLQPTNFLDEYFNANGQLDPEESSVKINLSDAGLYSNSKVTPSWSPYSSRFCQTQSVFENKAFMPIPNWSQATVTQSMESADCNENKRNGGISTCLLKNEQLGQFAEDALLSTRMVNLLLDDDNAFDGMSMEFRGNGNNALASNAPSVESYASIRLHGFSDEKNIYYKEMERIPNDDRMRAIAKAI